MLFIIALSKNKSSHLQILNKIGVVKIFAKFTGNYLCQSLFFNKDEQWRPGTSVFLVNFAKF